jgi:hypothetical protein
MRIPIFQVRDKAECSFIPELPDTGLVVVIRSPDQFIHKIDSDVHDEATLIRYNQWPTINQP